VQGFAQLTIGPLDTYPMHMSGFTAILDLHVYLRYLLEAVSGLDCKELWVPGAEARHHVCVSGLTVGVTNIRSCLRVLSVPGEEEWYRPMT
jgi:hypothetical protein